MTPRSARVLLFPVLFHTAEVLCTCLFRDRSVFFLNGENSVLLHPSRLKKKKNPPFLCDTLLPDKKTLLQYLQVCGTAPASFIDPRG